ncbi:MAG: DNA mismatch repair endonuclease MutL [bacterium]
MLSEDTIRRIAAGEVITRPAAVVKELAENSIDAGADSIEFEVKAGGKTLIRVSDNGCGMSRDDVRSAVCRHATSKLADIDDLRTLTSFGFRGEALAAVAAVSRLTIETCADETGLGTRLEVEGGEVIEVAEAARPRGTTVTARTLFFNLAPRRSFLKSDSYELRVIVETVRGYALAHPTVRFRVAANDRELLNLPPARSTRERLACLYEPRVVESMVELRVENPILAASGFLSDHTQLRAFYDVQQVFFNGRPVRNRTVTRALCSAYGPALATSRPNFVVFLKTDPARLDVNIHPTKEEVRFVDDRFLFDFLSEAASKALGLRRGEQTGQDEFLFQQAMTTEETAPTGFWQVHNSYIMAQVASGYVVVDQHAAHERVLYEEILGVRSAVRPQGLLFPITIDLTPDEHEAWEVIKGRLSSLGLEAQDFGGRTVVIEAVPAGAFIGKNEIREFFAELARVRADKGNLSDEAAKVMACKGAIKAGQKLSQGEMESLINRLFACREPYFCPHGRPAIIKITMEELDRKFGRT